MSLADDNTTKFWASCPKIYTHRRRSSSSGLFNINIKEPLLSKYKHLAKLHSDSSALGLNAVNKSGLPRGTLFRSSLPATPLTSPMYTGILHQFTEKAIQDLLSKSSTPKVVKSSSDYELKLDKIILKSSSNPQTGQKTRTNLFDAPLDQNIVTRGSLLIRPKTLDIKNKIKLETLSKINENDKLDEEIEKVQEKNNCSLSSMYYSIKEEQEEVDNGDYLVDESKSAENSINESTDQSNHKLISRLNDDKINSINLASSNNSTIVDKTQTKNDSTIETIILDDSSVINKIVKNLENISVNDNNKSNELNNSVKDNKSIEQNGVKHDEILSDSNELFQHQQQNCLFVKNLHYSLDNNELKEYFCKFGKVTKAIIIFDHNSKISKCFGFVTFSSQKDVQRILSMPKESFKLKGRIIQLSLAKNKRK